MTKTERLQRELAWRKPPPRERRADVPVDIADQMIPFAAKVGSIVAMEGVAMEGCLWHTSGANITKHQERALLFGYYSRSSIPRQWNFDVGLSAQTKAALSTNLKQWPSLASV